MDDALAAFVGGGIAGIVLALLLILLPWGHR